VAAGSVLIEFMEVAPGSVVEGVPGRVRREVDEEHRELARSVADDYVERAQQHVREDGLGSTTGD